MIFKKIYIILFLSTAINTTACKKPKNTLSSTEDYSREMKQGTIHFTAEVDVYFSDNKIPSQYIGEHSKNDNNDDTMLTDNIWKKLIQTAVNEQLLYTAGAFRTGENYYLREVRLDTPEPVGNVLNVSVANAKKMTITYSYEGLAWISTPLVETLNKQKDSTKLPYFLLPRRPLEIKRMSGEAAKKCSRFKVSAAEKLREDFNPSSECDLKNDKIYSVDNGQIDFSKSNTTTHSCAPYNKIFNPLPTSIDETTLREYSPEKTTQIVQFVGVYAKDSQSSPTNTNDISYAQFESGSYIDDSNKKVNVTAINTEIDNLFKTMEQDARSQLKKSIPNIKDDDLKLWVYYKQGNPKREGDFVKMRSFTYFSKPQGLNVKLTTLFVYPEWEKNQKDGLDAAFTASVRAALQTADIINYKGHSGSGRNWDLDTLSGYSGSLRGRNWDLDALTENVKDFSFKCAPQIVFLDGCSSGFWYSKQYIAAKKSACPHMTTDALHFLGTSFYSRNNKKDIHALLLKGLFERKSWQKIVDEMEEVLSATYTKSDPKLQKLRRLQLVGDRDDSCSN